MRSFDEVMRLHPFPFQMAEMQIEDATKIAEWGRTLGDLPVGYGKTCIATAAALMANPDTTIILLPPILIVQWGQWLRSIPNIGAVVEYEGTPQQRAATPVRGARWLIMSYGIFKNDYARLKHDLKHSEVLMVVDECFPAGTRVSTPSGRARIEDLRAGDLVFTSAGVRPILKVFENLTLQTITLRLSNGQELVCTENHPIFTDLGWLPAKDTGGRWLLSEAAMSDMSEGVSEEDIDTQLCYGEGKPDRNNLLKTLHGSQEVAERPKLLRQDSQQDQRETHTERPTSSRCEKKTLNTSPKGSPVENLPGERHQAATEARKRHRYDKKRSHDLRVDDFVGFSVESGSESGEETGRLPDELQVRLRQPTEAGGSRAGRRLSQKRDKKEAGRKERRKTCGVRVESVSYSERAGARTVYNLHIEGRHDYFAEGVLVHNCHVLKNYKSILHKKVTEFSLGRDLFLMTGTPMSTPADGYAYVKMNSPGIYRTFGTFENVHVAEKDFFGAVKKWQNLDLLEQNLNLRRVYRSKEEVHADLPKANYIPVYYELSKDHKKLYQKLMNEQLLELDNGGKIDATTAQKLYHYSQQIIANYGYFADDESKRSNLLDLIDELCDQIDLGRQFDPALNRPPASKFILWTQYKITSARMLAYMNTKAKAVAAYSGSDAKEAVRLFLHDPETVTLVAQPGSAGVGLNPQHLCWECLFTELPTTTIPFTQAAGRIDRHGQRYNPNIRIAIAKGTIQESLIRDLLHKDELVKRASGNLKGIKDLIFP